MNSGSNMLATMCLWDMLISYNGQLEVIWGVGEELEDHKVSLKSFQVVEVKRPWRNPQKWADNHRPSMEVILTSRLMEEHSLTDATVKG